MMKRADGVSEGAFSVTATLFMMSCYTVVTLLSKTPMDIVDPREKLCFSTHSEQNAIVLLFQSFTLPLSSPQKTKYLPKVYSKREVKFIVTFFLPKLSAKDSKLK